jgi:hypothetical protein
VSGQGQHLRSLWCRRRVHPPKEHPLSPSLVVGLVVFAVLLLVVVPSRRGRRLVFWLLRGGLRLLLAVVVLACALFHVAPGLAPPALAAILGRLLERLEDHLPALTLFRPIVSPWSILAVLAVITGLSLLRRLDHARRRGDQAARHRRTAPRADGRRAPTHWVSGLKLVWGHLAHGGRRRGVLEEQAALGEALADLLHQGGERPDEFARLLLIGYLQQATRLALTSDLEKACRYPLAGRGLGRLRDRPLTCRVPS